MGDNVTIKPFEDSVNPAPARASRHTYRSPSLQSFGSLHSLTKQGPGTMIEGLSFMTYAPFVRNCGGGGAAFDNMRYGCF